MSGRDEDEIFVPPEHDVGVFANDVVVYGDVEYATIDFLRIDPRDTSFVRVVARIAAPPSCILGCDSSSTKSNEIQPRLQPRAVLSPQASRAFS